MENNNEILHKINSGEPELITEAVKEVKENGDLEVAQALLRNLEQLKNEHTISIVVNLLADIKDNRFRGMLIQKIKETPDLPLKSQLLRIVWESSLDYSAHLELFLEILQHEDFTVAFEASTVIENMVHNLNAEQHTRLHTVIDSFPEEKLYLIKNIYAEPDFPEE